MTILLGFKLPVKVALPNLTPWGTISYMSSKPLQGSNLLAALRLFCLLLIGLYLAAPLMTEENAWGIWPVTYLSPVWRWLVAMLVALTLVPPAAEAIIGGLRTLLDRFHRFAVARVPAASTSRARTVAFLAIALLCLIPFSLFRIVHTRWGDAYMLVNGISYSDPALRLTATWQAPLDVWLHAKLWQAGHALFGWADAWPAYRLLSPLAGAVFVYALLRLADSAGRSRTEKLLIVGLMGTLGTMQLFFGYAENYSLAAAGVLVFLWLALETLADRRALWQPALALAITNGLHPSTIVLDPALLYVAWVWGRGRQVDKETRKQSRMGRGWWPVIWQVAWPMLAVAGVVVVLMEASGHGLATLLTTDRPGGGDAHWFVPLTAVSTRWEHYTMLSWPHLRDWLNEQVLTAPVTLGGLIIVGLALLNRRRTAGKAGQAAASAIPSELVFLLLCTALYWLFTWVWNPDYGGQRDWDLFSLAAIPSTLLFARLLPRALPDPGQLAQAGLMLIAVSAMHTTAWIYQNTVPWEWV